MHIPRLAIACSLAAGVLLAGAAHAAPAPKKPGPAATFPHTGSVRLPPGAQGAAAGLAFQPGLRFVPASPETAFWLPGDSARVLGVQVTDPKGQPLKGSGGQPLPFPVRFSLDERPAGSTGAYLSDGPITDPSELVVLTSASGAASVTLHRGSGAGLYRVTANLPAEFTAPRRGVARDLAFLTLTSGVPAGLTNLVIGRDHRADGQDSALVEVTALDVQDSPLDDAPLWSILRSENDAVATPMQPLGLGRYRGRVASHHAGLHGVEVFDPRTGFAVLDTTRFGPLGAAAIELVTESDLARDEDARSIVLSATVTDSGGNLLDAAGRVVTFTTDLGVVMPQPDDPAQPWAHLARLTSTDLGTARVVAEDQLSGLKDTLDVLLPAVSLGRGLTPVLTHRGADAPTRFTLPLRVYAQPPLGLLSAQIQVRFPPNLARFVGFEDADRNDPFVSQVSPGAPGELTVVTQTIDRPPMGEADLLLCHFECDEPGMTDLTFSTVVLNGIFPSGPATAGGIQLPTAPREEVSVLQKDYTKRICINIIYSSGCGDDFEKKMEKAVEELQKALNKGCCTIKIDKPTFCKVKNLGDATESWFMPEGGTGPGRETRLSGNSLKMIQSTKDCRKKECVNFYVPLVIHTAPPPPGRGQGPRPIPGLGGELGEADVPNSFDDNCNKLEGSIKDHDGKAVPGATAKDLSSAFMLCRSSLGGALDQETLNHVFVHEFGHMMGLPHYKKKEGAKENAMGHGKGTCFDAEQCLCIMKDINGFCLDL